MEALLQNNINRIYIIRFFQSFLLVVPIIVPLLQQHGLAMAEVLQTQAVFALTIAVCEVPSGYAADRWGRKPAILCGSVLTALAYAFLPLANGFADFVVFELLAGMGLSLCSGADLALLYDSQLQLNRISGGTRPPGAHIARLVSLDALAEGGAAVLASLLLLLSLQSVVLAQAIFSLVPAAFAIGLVEPRRQVSVSNHGNRLQRIVANLREQPLVGLTALAIIVSGLASVYAFWTYQKYWELQQVDVRYFGFLWAGYCLVASLAARFAGAIEHRLGIRNLLVLLAILPPAGFIGMALGSGWLGIACGLAFMLNRGLHAVVFYDALNKRVTDDYRATMNSMVSLGVRGLFIVTGPALGLLLDTVGMSHTLLILAACFAPTLLLVLWLLHRRIVTEALPPPVTIGEA